nr:PREDICTED: gastrula zinc finger protein XlCGF7.1-like [Bemisia tabaci]
MIQHPYIVNKLITATVPNFFNIFSMQDSPSRNEQRKFVCNLCGARYKNRHHLVSHAKAHTGETFCTICHKNYSNKHNYQMHLLMVHKLRQS